MPKNESLVYFYPYLVERRYQQRINKREFLGSNDCNDSKAFVQYSTYMDIIHENTDDFNPNRKHEILIVFDHMIADYSIVCRGVQSPTRKITVPPKERIPT